MPERTYETVGHTPVFFNVEDGKLHSDGAAIDVGGSPALVVVTINNGDGETLTFGEDGSAPFTTHTVDAQHGDTGVFEVTSAGIHVPKAGAYMAQLRLSADESGASYYGAIGGAAYSDVIALQTVAQGVLARSGPIYVNAGATLVLQASGQPNATMLMYSTLVLASA